MRKHSLASTCFVLLFPLVVPAAAEAALGPAFRQPTRDQSPVRELPAASLPAGSVIALNRDLSLHGDQLSRGTELIVGENGELATVAPGADGALLELRTRLPDLLPGDWTALGVNELTGELEPYFLPNDLDYAGPGRRRARRGGVTNCYHVVKQIVRRRITLTGVAAYMAAPQLRAAGWQRHDYASAPGGAVCVFAAGGRRTSSGGHIYGHIGVKGAGGIANPASGFHLGRPFLGCWSER